MGQIKKTPKLLDLYTQYCFRHLTASESLFLLEQAALIVPTSELLCDLGDLYMLHDEIERTIKCYNISSEMVPHRITPQYKLFFLYYSLNDTVQMRNVGEVLLSTPVKIQSTKTIRMKAEVRQKMRPQSL